MRVAATSPETVRDEVAELLGVSPDTLDPTADLIASGLDSIRMMALSGRWRKQGIEVGFAALAADPTVAAWAELVAAHGAPAAARVAPAADGNPGDPFPLAPIQHALWVGRSDTQELGGVAAHLYVEFDGAGVDPERLQGAATALAARHPMLRVEILPDGTQRIGNRGLPVTVVDLSDLDPESLEHRLAGIRDAKSHQLLDDEVLELTLSLLPGGRTRLHVDLDMQAADAVSYRTFMADLAALYRGRRLPELRYTYREYQAAQISSAPSSASSSDEDRRWWADRIPELPEPPALPLVPRAERSNPLRSTRRWHWFGPATREALFGAAQRRGITPAMAVAASYAGTLARWSSGRRFLLNLPMFGREPFHPDVDDLVGDFTSSLMLDLDLTDADTAASRAKIAQETLHTTARHAGYSGLSVLRDLSRHRGVQTLAPFVFTSAIGLGDLFAGEVTEQFGRAVWHISQGPQVLLDAQATPFDGGLLLNWDVREDAFRPGVVDAMFAHHLAELSRLATDDRAWDKPDPPSIPVSQRSVRVALNTQTAPPSGELLHEGFLRAAASSPDAPAVVHSGGELTYTALKDKVLAVAAALESRGVCRGDVVAVLGPKNADQVIAVLGILAAGAAYLPIGPDQPADRVARILDAGGVEFALLCGAHTPDLALPSLAVADAEIIGDPACFAAPEQRPTDLAYVLFTSGSTGEPKGVELPHDAAMNTVEFLSAHFGFGPTDRCLALSTLECDMSVLDIFATLRAGGTVVVVAEEHRRDPDSWARLIDAHGVTVLNFLPGWLEMLLEVDPADSGRLRSLRVVPTGGDWVRPELVRALRLRAPQMRFAGLGGATETAVHATICDVADPPSHWAAVPYGVPFPNMACRVVGPDGRECPDWVPGELWFSGRGVARGYRGRPDLTAQRFVEYDGRIWYRSGDLVRHRPDGTLEFVGRADHRIKVSGYRIELGEVEAALRRVPGVGAAVAAVVPGGGKDVLAALIRPGLDTVDIRAIQRPMAELVPAHMIPRLIVETDRIPFTVGGKIDRAEVTRRLSTAEMPTDRGHAAPGTPLESALARIVGEVLGRADVGAHHDFFSLGGDSVLATQVVARIRDWLDTPTAEVADIFTARTASALAALLSGREPDNDRLGLVAEIYLEVADMDQHGVVSAVSALDAAPARRP